MSWDQPEFSFDQAQHPTPTRTPTSPSFADVFQTPRLDPNLFEVKSAWNYGDESNATPNLLKTPRALRFNTPQGGSPAGFGASLVDQNANTTLSLNAEKLLSTPNFETLQMGQNTGFASPQKGRSSKNKDAANQIELSLDTSTSFKSASSMQTPPPTTTSASKRKGKLENSAQQAKSASSRRTSVPLAPKPIQTTPLQMQGHLPLGPLDLSPDMFGFNFTSPATAPPVPNGRLPWSHDGSVDMDFLTSDSNIFNTPGQTGLDPFGLSAQSHPHNSGAHSNLQDLNIMSSHSLPVHNEFMVSLQQSLAPNNAERSFGNVNPSLLFSSPSKVPPSLTDSAATRTLNEDSLQPYAYQIAEAKRFEKAYGGVAKMKKKRKPSVDSPAVQAALETLRDDKARRPQIRRSMTDSVLSAVSRGSRDSNPASSHGRSSPDKKTRKPRHHRTSLALTIDANGKARTEACVIEDSSDSASESAMDVDGRSDDDDIRSGADSSSSSDDAADDDDDNEPQLPQRQPRLGRFNHAASHAASHAGIHAHKTSAAGMRPSTSSALRSVKEASFGKEDGPSGAGAGADADASAELRKILQRRASAKRTGGSRHGFFSSPPEYGGAFHSGDSPTTLTDLDLATPLSARSRLSAGELGAIRCVCSSTRDEGQMVQCESCRNWLHVPCTGLQSTRLPEIYLCLFCTGSTPVARGGRVREPSRKGYAASTSPLAGKGRWR